MTIGDLYGCEDFLMTPVAQLYSPIDSRPETMRFSDLYALAYLFFQRFVVKEQ